MTPSSSSFVVVGGGFGGVLRVQNLGRSERTLIGHRDGDGSVGNRTDLDCLQVVTHSLLHLVGLEGHIAPPQPSKLWGKSTLKVCEKGKFTSQMGAAGRIQLKFVPPHLHVCSHEKRFVDSTMDPHPWSCERNLGHSQCGVQLMFLRRHPSCVLSTFVWLPKRHLGFTILEKTLAETFVTWCLFPPHSFFSISPHNRPCLLCSLHACLNHGMQSDDDDSAPLHTPRPAPFDVLLGTDVGPVTPSLFSLHSLQDNFSKATRCMQVAKEVDPGILKRPKDFVHLCAGDWLLQCGPIGLACAPWSSDARVVLILLVQTHQCDSSSHSNLGGAARDPIAPPKNHTTRQHERIYQMLRSRWDEKAPQNQVDDR